MFTKIFNRPDAGPEFADMRVVAAFPSGSDDIPESVSHVPPYTEEMRKAGVEIVDSIPALLERVDAVLVESIDGRKHLEQARPVIAAGKPLFIDKPVAGTSGRCDRDLSPGGRKERSLLFQLLAAVQPCELPAWSTTPKSERSWAATLSRPAHWNRIIPTCSGTACMASKFCSR